jgi:catechol-2,3-dioxygenase
VRPSRQTESVPNPEGIGNLHHIAFTVSRATYNTIAQRLNERGIANTGPIDRGFMDSIYFRDPNGQQLEIAVYKFEPPAGYTHGDVLAAAHNLRVADGAYAIADRHLADALAQLVAHRAPRIETPAASDALTGAHDPRATR